MKSNGSLALFSTQYEAQAFAQNHDACWYEPLAKRPLPKLTHTQQPQPTDAVLGGQDPQPRPTDAVLGNKSTASREQLYRKLKSVGGTWDEWQRLAIEDRINGCQNPQLPQVKPYMMAWNRM